MCFHEIGTLDQKIGEISSIGRMMKVAMAN